MEGIQTLKGSWPWPWPSIGPYGISSCISHRPLPIYQISFKLKKLFVDGQTYGRTYGRADGHFSLYIIRSTLGSRPKNTQSTLNRKLYKRNKIKKNSNKSSTNRTYNESMNWPDGRSYSLTTQVTKVQPEPTFHNTARKHEGSQCESIGQWKTILI